jgi:hypothetical protein
VILPLETRLALLYEFDPTAVKSFDDLVALDGKYGADAVYEWIGSLVHSNDETVGAELEASCRDDLGLDDKTVSTPEFEPAGKPADVLAGEPVGLALLSLKDDDDNLDPEIMTETSPVEFSGIVVFDVVTMAMLFEAVDSVEEFIPWLVVVKPEIGKIKKRRYTKRGDGTRRHGRPPDLTLGGSFGHIESWNMGVYPGLGPALISRADMIILPPTTPPPSRTPPPATTTLCPPRADEGVAGPVDVLKGLPRNLFVALSGLSAAGNASPPTANSGIPKSSELSVSNPANPSS